MHLWVGRVLFWWRVRRGHRVAIQLLCRQDTPSMGCVVLLQHPSRHYITQLESTHHPTNLHTHCACAYTPLHLHHTDICVHTTPFAAYSSYQCRNTHHTHIRHKMIIVHTTLMTADTQKILHMHLTTKACIHTSPSATHKHTHIHTSLHTLNQRTHPQIPCLFPHHQQQVI